MEAHQAHLTHLGDPVGGEEALSLAGRVAKDDGGMHALRHDVTIVTAAGRLCTLLKKRSEAVFTNIGEGEICSNSLTL